MEPLSLFLVTLTKNIKSQDIFRPNGLKAIIIKIELYRDQTAQCSDKTAKIFAMSGITASNPLDIYGAVVATCIRNALKRQIQNLCQAAAIAP
jgi:hypothetical protein